MSSATRLTPDTSLMMRLLIFSRRSYGRRAQSAVIASSEVTARVHFIGPAGEELYTLSVHVCPYRKDDR